MPARSRIGMGVRRYAVTRQYAVALGTVALGAGASAALSPVAGDESLFLLYFAAVAVSSLAGGIGPGLAATIGSAVVADLVFFPPYYAVAIEDPQVRVRFLAFLAEASFISVVCGLLRSAKRRAEEGRPAQLDRRASERADKLHALGQLTRLMTSAPAGTEVFDAISGAAARLLGAAIAQVWVAADDIGVLTIEGSSTTPRVPADMEQVTIPYGAGVVGRIFESRVAESVEDIAEEPRWLNRRLVSERGLHGFVGLPLLAGDRAVGVLAILFEERRRLTAEEGEVGRLLADHAAIAIENARLFAEERTRGAQLTALLDVNKKIGSVMAREVLLHAIAEEAAHLLGVDNAVFRVVEGDDLVVAGVAGSAREIVYRQRIRIGESLSGKVVPAGRALILDINTIPDVIPEHLTSDRRLGYQTFLGVPVRVGTRTVGVLTFRARRSFSARDRDLAEAFAGQAAIAIEHVRLYRESLQRAERMKALADVGRALSEALEVHAVVHRVREKAAALLGADLSALYRLDGDAGTLTPLADGDDAEAAALESPAVTAVAALAARERTLVATSNVANDTRPGLAGLLEGKAEPRAVLAVPLLVQDRVVGVLALGDRPGRVFDAEEISLAEAFADQAAVALENARLYQQAREAYGELERTQATLIRGETLRAVGQLAAGAAHHLNNLLAVVLGRLELTLRKFDTPELRRDLGPARLAVEDGADVVRRLATFVRGRGAVALEAVDLNQLVQDVLELTRFKWQDEAELHGIRIDVRLDTRPLAPVAGDPSSLREVLVNLMLNAMEAMPGGGVITIRTWQADDTVHCAIADSGTGMAADVLRRAVEPFFTTKGVKATGLGLSLSHGIVQQHGGQLSIESLEGQGTTVTVRLPAPAGAVPAVRLSERAVVRPLRVLLIEDELEVRRVIGEMLSADGHHVIEAAAGAEGLARLAKEPAVDLVLTDLGMPGMTGWDVARAVRASRPTVIVGIITGWGEIGQTATEDRRLADFVLTKPLTRDALRAGIAHGCVRAGRD